MAQTDTKYILVDWEERESYVYTKEEMYEHLRTVMDQSGYSLSEDLDRTTEDLDLEVYKVTKSQLPKRIVLQIGVTINWKELT